MAQLISDGRSGFKCARDDAQAFNEVNVQATFLIDEGKDLPSSPVIDFPPQFCNSYRKFSGKEVTWSERKPVHAVRIYSGHNGQ